MSNFFDVRSPLAEVRPSLLSKINTALQLGLFFLLTGNPLWHLDELMLFPGYTASFLLESAVAGLTIGSGIDYALTSRKVFRTMK
jgi:phosphatidylglycerophosphate synthase